MKTWAVALIAKNANNEIVTHLIFISAFDVEEIKIKSLKACDVVYPEAKGYTEHRVAFRDTQPMNDEMRFIHEWDEK